jgi:hypothetical protein
MSSFLPGHNDLDREIGLDDDRCKVPIAVLTALIAGSSQFSRFVFQEAFSPHSVDETARKSSELDL